MLLFGIGICAIERTSLPHKRPRIECPSPSALQNATATRTHHHVHTLFLGDLKGGDLGEQFRVLGAPCQVDALLEVVGGPVTGLSLSDARIDDELLKRCLRRCPRLQSLRLDGCALKTLDPIMRSYEWGGQISSVHFTGIEVTPTFLAHFESFLSALLMPGAMQRTLKKLRIGSEWTRLFRPSTAEVMMNVLKDPRTLDYLHLYRCDHPCVVPPIEWDIVKHNYELIPTPGRPSLDERVAFAFVLKHLGSADARFAQLDASVLAPVVLEFVGQSTYRVAVSEVSAYYGSSTFGIGRNG